MCIVILGRGQMNSLPPSRSNRRSFHAIICELHLKSLRKVSSDFPASSKGYLSLLRLLGVLNMYCSGEIRKVFPQFAGPAMKIFWFLPLPSIIRSWRVSANTIGCTQFAVSTYTAHCSHWQSFPRWHSFSAWPRI